MTSIPDLSQLDPEEQIKRNLIAKPDLTPGLNLPAIGPPSQMTQDVAQLNHLQNAPKFMGQQSGIASLQPKSTLGKIGKGILGGLDTLGSIATPGLMLRIPGTSMHHKGLEAQAEGKVAGDVAEEQKQQQVNNETANAETEREKVGELKRHNQAEEAVPVVGAKWSVVPGVIGPNGQILQQSDKGDLRWGTGITGAQPLKPPTPGNFEEQEFAEWKKTHPQGTMLQFEAERSKDTQKPERPPQVTMIVPGANGTSQVISAKPGQTLPSGAQTPAGFSTSSRPTQQMRNVSAQAKVAADGIPQVTAEIDRLGDKLGPITGRWNEFMQGKIGTNDPDFAGLRTDLLMLSSAVALAHARGRLPENLREEFDNAINAPQQTPENLKAVLAHVLPWMQKVAQMGDMPGQGGAGDTTTQAPAQVPSFADWKKSQAQ